MKLKLFFFVLLVFVAGSITTLAQPTLLTPLDGATGVALDPTLTWTAVGGATNYRLEINSDIGFAPGGIVFSALVGNVTSYYYNSGGLTYLTPYYWRVRVEVPAVGGWSSGFSFTTLTLPAPSVPTLLSPIADEVVSEDPTLIWNASTPSSPGLTYTLQVTPDPTFYYVPAGLNISGIAINSQALTSLDRGSPYYWRVKATNETGSSAWSSVRNFVVSLSGSVTPPVPVLTFPSDASTIHGWSIDLAWYSNYFGDQLTYDLEWGTDINFLINTTPVNIGVPGTTTYNLAGLDASTTYYWRVKGIKGADESVFSAAYSFTTPPLVAATVPVPSWPIGATEIYNTTPTLYWYLNSNSVGLTFDLQYNLVDNTFDGDEISVPGLLVSNYTLPALTAEQVVYWRVLSDNGAQQSLWSATESFSVANTAAVPVVPTISWPQGGTIVYATATDLNWYVNGNSTDLSYEVQFAPSTTLFVDDANPAPTVVAANTFLLNESLNWATTYHWRVRSTDGSTFSAWSTETTFSTFGVAGANVPIQSWPLNGVTVYQTTQQLSWYVNGPSSGYTYDVEVNGTQVATTQVPTTYVVPALVAGQTYYWRVRSHSGASTSNWSPLLSFYAYSGFAPMAPLLATPINGVSVVTTSPQLSWFINTPTSSLNYELQVSEDAVFTAPTTVSNLNSSSYQTDNLALNKTYYWRVRSKGTGGNFSNYSKAERFAVGSLTGVENNDGKIPTEFSIDQNYPNPFNPTTTIKYSIPEVSFVNIKIYDMLGREVKTLVSSQQKAGSYDIRWNGENNYGSKVASGTYIYRVTAGDYSKALKLMLLK